MDDDQKADLARKGMRAAELLEPGRLKDKAKERVTDAVEDAALDGLAKVARWTGQDRSPARTKAVQATDLGDVMASFDTDDAAHFEQRLRQAAARKAKQDKAKKMSFAELRRSFPKASRELALLIFNCVDLLEDLSEDAEGKAPSAAVLAQKEQLFTRIADLLGPRADEALKSFVAHVVALSRAHRAG